MSVWFKLKAPRIQALQVDFGVIAVMIAILQIFTSGWHQDVFFGGAAIGFYFLPEAFVGRSLGKLICNLLEKHFELYLV